MAPTWLETDVNANIDISGATAVGVYTSTGDKFVMPQLLADQVAGGGDYVYYVTLQVGGAGSSYVIGPKTTHTAGATETAIGAQGGFIAVRSGDVLTVYVDGLAGDTATPDVTVRWFELDATATVSSGGITTASFAAGAINAAAIAADAIGSSELAATAAAEIAAAVLAGGSGTYSYSNTVDDGSGNLLDGVYVQLATDTGFTNIINATHTNSLGAFTVYSDTAGTHYLRLQLSGYAFTTQTVTTA